MCVCVCVFLCIQAKAPISKSSTKPSKAVNGESVKKSPKKLSKVNPTEEIELPDPDDPNGFDRGLTPKQIVGATELNGHILFLIQWWGLVGMYVICLTQVKK